jgi:rhodanese-related sulfurtransferase
MITQRLKDAENDRQNIEQGETLVSSNIHFSHLVSAVTCVLVFGWPWSARAAEHTKDSLDTVKERLKDKSAVLVDVREEKEWDDGHIQDAKLMPLSKLKKEAEAEKLTKDLSKKKIVYCHCAAGARALTAADILKKQGYDVRPLKPGYNDLLKAGFQKAEKDKK